METLNFLQSLHGCLEGVTLSGGLYAGLFLAGLIGGITHCAFMCGPFVLSMSGSVEKLREAALIPYHLGRLTTYMFLAVLFSAILNLAYLFLPVKSLLIAPLLFTAGVIFLVTAFPNIFKRFSPFIAIRSRLYPVRRIYQAMEKIKSVNGALGRYLMGLVLGFMPCGLVIAALMAAASAGSSVQAALAMMAFGVGTMPSLLVTAYGGRALFNRFPKFQPYLTRGAMTLSALWLFVIAGALLL